MCKSTKRLDLKTVLVTGGTAGMGLEISTEFARRGSRVIIACPFEDEGMKAKNHIIKETGNTNVVFKFLDLASLKSVRIFANDILKHEERLDILVNNAGVALVPEYITEDGLNFVLQVNYYGTFLLTLLLLPLLKKTGSVSEPTRIVNTSSFLHMFGEIELENINKVGFYKFITTTYANSKLCVLLFTRELAKRLKGRNIIVTAVDPGFVGTAIFTYKYKILGSVFMYILYLISKTPWQGAQTALFASLDSRVEKFCGEVFKECQVYKASSKAYDNKKAELLWNHSIETVKLTNKEISSDI